MLFRRIICQRIHACESVVIWLRRRTAYMPREGLATQQSQRQLSSDSPTDAALPRADIGTFQRIARPSIDYGHDAVPQQLEVIFSSCLVFWACPVPLSFLRPAAGPLPVLHQYVAAAAALCTATIETPTSRSPLLHPQQCAASCRMSGKHTQTSLMLSIPLTLALRTASTKGTVP